jgi:hypothetical protein
VFFVSLPNLQFERMNGSIEIGVALKMKSWFFSEQWASDFFCEKFLLFEEIKWRIWKNFSFSLD